LNVHAATPCRSSSSARPDAPVSSWCAALQSSCFRYVVAFSSVQHPSPGDYTSLH
jgi:hypothetical protein